MDMLNQKTKFKKIVVTGKVGKELIDFIEADIQKPEQNEVRIKVQAAGLAYADIMAKNGNYPAIPKYPYSPGYDIVGTIDKIGSEVSGFKNGQKVAALLTKFGGFQEYVNVESDMLVAVPDNLDSAEVVSLILNYLTAYQMMHKMAEVKSGESVLITSAAGGVGTALIQLGKLAGLKMFGTASKTKLELVEAQGAIAIDYKNEDFAKRLASELNGNSLDVVFDAIGAETTTKAYSLLGKGGRLVSYGFLSVNGSLLPSLIKNFFRKIRPDGKKLLMNMGLPPMVDKNNSWYQQTLSKIIKMYADGELSPVVDKQFSLAEVSKAMEILESGKARGKVVILTEYGKSSTTVNN